MTAKSIETKLEVLCTKMDALKEDVDEIKRKLEAKYITKDQFEPIKRIVYGMVGIVLISVVTAVLKLVVFQ